ncbi:MAG: prolipoprotein diacylglyceryl transferase [Aliifodinibius sp.]|nr:prolipoprotein diacylglyceryl transferase [Fodinibius sp.]
MYPELFQVGPVVISSYGLLLALAFILALIVTSKLAAKRGIEIDAVMNLAFVVMISAIIGARVLYVLFHLEEFKGRWLYTLLPIQRDGTIGLSGLVLLGGVLAAISVGFFYVKHKKLPLWKVTDSIAPSLALGIFIGRIGCFLNGCCFGKECSLPWAVRFPLHSPAGLIMKNSYLHPTQLYSSFYALLIFLILIGLDRRQLYDGFLSGLFLVCYGIGRFTVDFFRYYEEQMFVIDGLDINQLISVFMFISGISIIIKRSMMRKNLSTA